MDGEGHHRPAAARPVPHGLLRTFQIAHEFASMTVRENLMMVPGGQSGEAIWNAWFRRAAIRAEEAALRGAEPTRCWTS